MTPDQVKGSYRRTLTDVVTIRRYTGTGVNRTWRDVTNVHARIYSYQPHELVGTIVQGDSKAILFADDLIDQLFNPSLNTNDKIVVGGKELAIVATDAQTRKIGHVLIAYELQIRG